MSAPHELKTPAVVIRRARLKEADRVITFFTREFGKVSAVAIGVRKGKSKLAGHLEILTYTDLTLASGKNLDTIIGSQTLSPYLGIRNSLERTAYGLYFAELVSHFAPEGQANQALFALLVETLENLNSTSGPEPLSLYFELQLLKTLGYQPELRRCVGCRSELKETTNFFAPASGGILCPDCAVAAPASYAVSVSGLKVMRFFLENRYESAARLRIERALNIEVTAVTRAYIQHLLEKSCLKSASWLEQIHSISHPANLSGK
jgi:DNA repair protein RecO (recombination protein O)